MPSQRRADSGCFTTSPCYTAGTDLSLLREKCMTSVFFGSKDTYRWVGTAWYHKIVLGISTPKMCCICLYPDCHTSARQESEGCYRSVAGSAGLVSWPRLVKYNEDEEGRRRRDRVESMTDLFSILRLSFILTYHPRIRHQVPYNSNYFMSYLDYVKYSFLHPFYGLLYDIYYR